MEPIFDTTKKAKIALQPKGKPTIFLKYFLLLHPSKYKIVLQSTGKTL